MKGFIPILVTMSGLLIGCGEKAAEPVQDASTDVTTTAQEWYDQAADTVTETLNDTLGDGKAAEVTEWAKEDLKKIGDWQYHIVTVELGDDSALENQLNTLGEDRWELFWVKDEGRMLRLVFKRPTRNYISKIPFSQIGQLVTGDGPGP